ncbi:hypothetical protein [Nocardioides sp. R-C-SC26]|uniref:hypothetical protein n=1 Tax=Nocardioides sp. R-C-SC26 TaxID=2870414 RepID=UPI001E2A73F9|nr:hypothetical protein [Nocardioides sp. R-C-SC26]
MGVLTDAKEADTLNRYYPYRTTADKLEQAHEAVASSGDSVISAHHVGGRDWILLCRSGEPKVAELTPTELAALIERSVRAAVGSATR